MENSHNQSDGALNINAHNEIKKFGLSKKEILRGHDAFLFVLRNSVVFSTDYLKLFVNKVNVTEPVGLNQSPLLTNSLKVGFIIARKKIRKAVLRNRIRRLLKESFRLNKHLFCSLKDAVIIFSLSEKGYQCFLSLPSQNIFNFNNEMIQAAEKINKYFSDK